MVNLADYELVAIVRNPYARIISYLNWLLSFKTYKQTGKIDDNRSHLSELLKIMVGNNQILDIKNKPRYQDENGNVGDVIVTL